LRGKQLVENQTFDGKYSKINEKLVGHRWEISQPVVFPSHLTDTTKDPRFIPGKSQLAIKHGSP
jgi:hypothetical protein